MKRAGDWIAWGLARVGWPGWLGLALLIGGLLACLVQVRPMGEEAERLRLRTDLLASQPRQPQTVAQDRDWRADLPDRQDGYGSLAKLFGAAGKAGLALAEGNYREVRDASAGLTRLNITLPISGDYASIRDFLAQALNQEPALALENLRIERGRHRRNRTRCEPAFHFIPEERPVKPRHAVLGLLLAGVAAAAFWPGADEPAGVVEPITKHRNPTAAPAPASPDQPVAVGKESASRGARPAMATTAQADLFPAQTFRPPPPPSHPAPPPLPMAPPLPFGFLGAWTEAGRQTVFLAQGDRTLTGQKGDRLAGGWRLDDITPGAVLFTYEPLNQQRTLRIAP